MDKFKDRQKAFEAEQSHNSVLDWHALACWYLSYYLVIVSGPQTFMFVACVLGLINRDYNTAYIRKYNVQQ